MNQFLFFILGLMVSTLFFKYPEIKKNFLSKPPNLSTFVAPEFAKALELNTCEKTKTFRPTFYYDDPGAPEIQVDYCASRQPHALFGAIELFKDNNVPVALRFEIGPQGGFESTGELGDTIKASSWLEALEKYTKQEPTHYQHQKLVLSVFEFEYKSSIWYMVMESKKQAGTDLNSLVPLRIIFKNKDQIKRLRKEASSSDIQKDLELIKLHLEDEDR